MVRNLLLLPLLACLCACNGDGDVADTGSLPTSMDIDARKNVYNNSSRAPSLRAAANRHPDETLDLLIRIVDGAEPDTARRAAELTKSLYPELPRMPDGAIDALQPEGSLRQQQVRAMREHLMPGAVPATGPRLSAEQEARIRPAFYSSFLGSATVFEPGVLYSRVLVGYPLELKEAFDRQPVETMDLLIRIADGAEPVTANRAIVFGSTFSINPRGRDYLQYIGSVGADSLDTPLPDFGTFRDVEVQGLRNGQARLIPGDLPRKSTN